MASWNFSNRYRDGLGQGLPNHIYVDNGCISRSGGDDSNGDGTINNPYKTASFALSQAVANDTIILAPSEYENDLGSSSTYVNLQNSISIKGDSKNKDVILKDTVGDKLLFENNQGTVVIKDITIIGYKTPLRQTFFQQILEGVTFIDSTDGFVNIVGLNMIDVTFINNDAVCYNSTNIQGGKFYNSNIVNEVLQSDRFFNLTRCYLDRNCFHSFGGGAGFNRLDDCHIHDLTTFDNGDDTRLTINANVIDEQNNPALFVSPSYLDFAVQLGSPLLKVTGFNIGSVYRGLSFSPDQQGFVDIVTNNPDVEIVNSEIRLVSSVPSGESRTVSGFSVTSSDIDRLSTPFQIGISSKCNYVFEVRVADVGADISQAVWQEWKPYRLGERMTQNLDGTSTGEDNYNWLDNNFVSYKFVQGRLVMTQP